MTAVFKDAMNGGMADFDETVRKRENEGAQVWRNVFLGLEFELSGT